MSESGSSGSRNAAVGAGETAMGPEKLPTKDVFSGVNSGDASVFGDKSSRSIPSSGMSLAMGLSERVSIADVTPESLGQGRDDSTGKPDGPAMGSCDNGGADAKLTWG